MKKHILSLFALVIVAQASWCASITAPADIPSYWSSADGKKGDALWTAVSAQTNKNFSSIGYDGLWGAYQKTDVYPAGHPKAGQIWDMYGECDFTASDRCGSYSGVCDCFNREHSIPQSWWGKGTGGIGNDIFHVLPTDGKINGVRSNDEYGVVNGGKDWNGNKSGTAGSWSTDKKTIASAAGETVNGSGNVFEPKNEYKGDWARGIMGTIIKWQKTDITSGNNFFSGSYTASSNYGLTKKAVVLLMKWHREDPVSQKEIDRNNGIQETQGNRNPFIDYPYLAEYIWGEHAGETIDMSKLMPSTDSEFIPGVSDGSRDGSTPVDPINPPEKFTVTWMANGEEVTSSVVEENKKPTWLPTAPASCSSESDQFAGWTTTPIEGTSDEAPAVLYKQLQDIPAVTEDVTLYAVFARQSSEGGAPATYSYSVDNQADGWSNTATLMSNTYWLLETGKTIVSPEIDLAGLSKITVKMRTYGGTQNDQLDITANDGKLTSMEASKGSTMTEYTWTNNLNKAGNSALTFSSTYGTKKGIGIQSIDIDATGSAVKYDRYITSCQSGSEVVTGVDEVHANTAARKILVGNQLYVIVGEKLYTIQGEVVK